MDIMFVFSSKLLQVVVTILCLAAAHASIFNRPRPAFLIKSVREAFLGHL